MSALVINGMVAPVTTDSPGLTWVEHGSRGRSGSGRAALQRVAFIRRLTGGMSWQRREEAVAWAALLMGRGDVWHYDLSSGVAVTTSSKGRAAASSPTAVVSTRASEIIAYGTSTEVTHPKFGDGCIAIEDALANNLFTSVLGTQNVATGTDTSSDVTGFAAVASGTRTSDNADVTAWQGTRVLKVVAAGASDGARVNNVAAPSDAFYTGSVYLRVASGTLAVTVNMRNDTAGENSTVNVTLSTSWKRVEVTTANPATTSDNLQFIITTTSGAGTFYADGFQLEASAYATTWTATSRSAGALAYTLPMVRPTDDITVMCWARQPYHGFASPSSAGYLFELGTSSESFWVTSDNSDSTIGITSGGADQSQAEATPLNDNATNGGWTHVAAVLRRNPQTGNYKLTLLFDGAVVAFDTPTALPTWTSAPILRVGADASGNNRWNGLIDDLVVLPFALSTAQIAEVYAAGSAWSNLPALDCYGDLLPGTSSASPLAMVGLPPRLATVAARQGSATTTEVNHAVSFELEEDAPEGY